MNAHELRPGDRWDDALGEAFARLPVAGAGSSIFLEEREDLRIEADTVGRFDLVSTRARGAAVRSPFELGRELYLPDPTEVEIVQGAAQIAASEVPPPRPSDSGEGAEPSYSLDRDAGRRYIREVLQAVVGASRGVATVAARVRYVGFRQDIRVARQDGILADSRMGERLHLQVEVSAGGAKASASGEWVIRALGGFEAEPLVADVVQRALVRREAKDLGDRDLPIVFAPGVGGILIHELVGHPLEADTVQGGRSYLAAMDGRVAPASVTVLDDPRRSRAPWQIDDEGEGAGVTVLVEFGRVVGALFDLRTASRVGTRSTGHGRRTSFQDSVRPRMGCTFLAPGSSSPESILDSISKGVYVRRMEAAQVDVRSGRAVFKISDGDWIESGRLVHPIQPMFMSVLASRALSNIHQVASDLSFDTCIGSCLRDGQPMVASVGAPTFCVGVARLFS